MNEDSEQLTILHQHIKARALNLKQLLSLPEFHTLSEQGQCELLLFLSKNNITAEQFEEAQEGTLLALERAKEAKLKLMQATLWNHLGTIAKRTNDLNRAERFFKTSLKLLQQLNHLQGQSSVLNNLGNVALLKGDYKRAKSYFLEAKKKGIDDPEDFAITTLNLSNCYMQLGNLSSAKTELKEIENKNQLSPQIQGEIATIKGQILSIKEEWDAAIHEFIRALDLLEPNSPIRLIVLRNLGSSYSGLQKFNEAIQIFEEYLREAKTDALERSEVLLLLGNIFIQVNDAKRVEECLNAAFNVAKTPEAQINALNSLHHWQKTSSPEKALETLKKMENILKNYNDPFSIASVQELISELEFSTGKFEKGFLGFKLAQEGYLALKEYEQAVRIDLKLASVYLYQKKWQNALESLNAAEEKAKRFKLKTIRIKVQSFQQIVQLLINSTDPDLMKVFNQLHKQAPPPTKLLLYLSEWKEK
ncbi:MAG: tetratricopeptide repeat protein [Promethearchaeota archaeon]